MVIFNKHSFGIHLEIPHTYMTFDYMKESMKYKAVDSMVYNSLVVFPIRQVKWKVTPYETI